MKIAVLNTGSINDRKGAFNNVHDRIKHLQVVKGVKVDAYLIRHYDDWVFRLLRNKTELKEDISEVDGVKYNNLWVKHKIIDHILTIRLKIKDISCKSQLDNYLYIFKDYDLLSVHSLPDMYIAYLVKQKYGIPFVTTWHGSDINVWPFVNKKGFETTKLIIENADYNFFVSKRLLLTSDKIAKTSNKDYLYTGPSENFHKMTLQEKNKLRNQLNLTSKYLIGFIGNLFDIKNVLVLPNIFHSINKEFEGVSFIIVGNGKLSNELKKKMHKYRVENVIFTGKVEPEKIPNIMACLDILLLPSKNEGLPLVTLEALTNGVQVVGSDVGGIPESIGEENAFPLDNNFVQNVSNRVVEIIKNGEEPKPLSDEFSWDRAIEKEMKVYTSILRV